jgi:hypothetical protein
MNQTQTECFREIQMNLGSSNFEALVIETIDQTLSKLGIGVKQVFYSFLEHHYKLGKEDIPARIGDFDDALGKIFGPSASIVEIDILKGLQQKVPSFIYTLESTDLSLVSYLVSLKQHLENL